MDQQLVANSVLMEKLVAKATVVEADEKVSTLIRALSPKRGSAARVTIPAAPRRAAGNPASQ
jgi:hypothetical protein